MDLVREQLEEAALDDGTLLVMSSNLKDRNSLNSSAVCRGHDNVRVQTVASSAGGTATLAVLAQPGRGHLNGDPNDQFDLAECYARCIVGATRSQNLTVIISPLDMLGVMGLIQVLAARAHTVAQVNRGETNWTMPLIYPHASQSEQSASEINSWRVSHAGNWDAQTMPPLAIIYLNKQQVDGSEQRVPVRLRLVLAQVNHISGALLYEDWLKTYRENAPDCQWMPKQSTDAVLVWGYAAVGKFKPYLWMCPPDIDWMGRYDRGLPRLLHWRTNFEVDTEPIPGIHFFDMWRMHPCMSVKADDVPADLQATDYSDAPAETGKKKADEKETALNRRQIQREQILTAREASRTVAQEIAEMGSLHELNQVLVRGGATINRIEESKRQCAIAQEQRAQEAPHRGSRKRAADGRAPRPVDPRPYDSSHEGTPTVDREFVDELLAIVPSLPDKWPLMKIDIILNKCETYYATFRRYLHINEHLRTGSKEAADRVLDNNTELLTEHLVEFLCEWILATLEPARILTEARQPEYLFLHEKDYWFKQIWIDLHQSVELDRPGSANRAPVGLVRCLCKDTKTKQKHSMSVKLRMSNLHIFVPIWMAPAVIRQWRLYAEDENERAGAYTQGTISYKEAWFTKQDAGTTGDSSGTGDLSGLQIHVDDLCIEQFNHLQWPAIEEYAANGLLRQDVWGARLSWAGITARFEVPVTGTVFAMEKGTLLIRDLPDCWPLSAEEGFLENMDKQGNSLAAIAKDLEESQFTAPVFAGNPDVQALRWESVVWDTWPNDSWQFRELWNSSTQVGQPARSGQRVTGTQYRRLQDAIPPHQCRELARSEYIWAIWTGRSTEKCARQHGLLHDRQIVAAHISTHLDLLRKELEDVYNPWDIEKILQYVVDTMGDNVAHLITDMNVFGQLVLYYTQEFEVPMLTQDPSLLGQGS